MTGASLRALSLGTGDLPAEAEVLCVSFVREVVDARAVAGYASQTLVSWMRPEHIGIAFAAASYRHPARSI